jgi:hypothetical protein
MDAGFACAHGLGARRVRNACCMYNIDGTLHAKSGTHYVDLEIATNVQTHVCRFLLMDLSDDVIVLGFPWLCKFEPQISWHNARFGPEYSDVRFKTIPPRPRSDAGQSSSSAAWQPRSLRDPSPSDKLGSNTTSPASTPPSSPRPRGRSLSRQPHLDGRASVSVAHRTRETSVTGDLPQVPPPQASSNAVIAPRKEGNVMFPSHVTSASAIEKGKWLEWRDAPERTDSSGSNGPVEPDLDLDEEELFIVGRLVSADVIEHETDHAPDYGNYGVISGRLALS